MVSVSPDDRFSARGRGEDIRFLRAKFISWGQHTAGGENPSPRIYAEERGSNPGPANLPLISTDITDLKIGAWSF